VSRQDAPHLLREVSGDFAVEVSVLPASDEKPRIGGLLLWGGKNAFLRLEYGNWEKNEVGMLCYLDEEEQLVGRGFLPPGEDGSIRLRLERSGSEIYGYCSADGIDWCRCGKVEFPADDPIQVGIHAISNIDRTIYCGSYKEGTATVFRYFWIVIFCM